MATDRQEYMRNWWAKNAQHVKDQRKQKARQLAAESLEHVEAIGHGAYYVKDHNGTAHIVQVQAPAELGGNLEGKSRECP